jgi:hypothetical protein
MKLLKIITLSFFTFLFGCNKSSNLSFPNLNEITEVSDQEEGFKDIIMNIVSVESIKDTHIFIAKGLFHSKIVGLKFEVKSNIQKGINIDGSLDAKNGFIRDGIKISSIGEESNEFIKALSQIYGFPTEEKFTSDILTPTSFSLNNSIANLDFDNHYKFKLFFRDCENDQEEEYCEIFFNINTKDKTIELFEKDEEYRKLLIDVFTNSKSNR